MGVFLDKIRTIVLIVNTRNRKSIEKDMMPLDLHDPIKKRSPVARLVGAYRWYLGSLDAPMSPSLFAAELSLPLADAGRVISPAHIRCWEKDFTIPHDESLDDLTRCVEPDSWQWHFAQDIKAAKYPWRYAPSSEIGFRILGRNKHLSSECDFP